MSAYYNENDVKKAAWMRELISEGHIAPGDVDERSIKDVRADDLRGYRQCHFFAGVGIWSYALRQAGWPDYREVWTGSCPCQSFSVAGQKKGFADERHLWPDWFRLIGEFHPSVVFGEQSASKGALTWFDLVQSDLEAANYTSAALDICAAGIGAPHIRQRLYFVADSPDSRRDNEREHDGGSSLLPARFEQRSAYGLMGDSSNPRLEEWGRQSSDDGSERTTPERTSGAVSRLEQSLCIGWERREESESGSKYDGQHARRLESNDGSVSADEVRTSEVELPGPVNGHWGPADWLRCTDDKWRAVEAGTFPLADGYPQRVGLLRGYGDAIVAPLAQAFIEAYLETGR